MNFPSPSDNPIDCVHHWLNEAKAHPHIHDYNAMTVASVDERGHPSARILLLKELTEQGFTFFTNYESRKGNQLAVNPFTALCFFWDVLQKQIRVEGKVHRTTAAVSDAYFASRARGSQISAVTSKQSQPIASYEAFAAELAENEKRFAGKDIPRPAHWGGYVLVPTRIEFWQQVEFRRHQRMLFTRDYPTEAWKAVRLSP